MPWPYAADAGIVKKWADKYGITINVTQINDYVESINQYTAGKFDGVTVTNMDALTIPAAGGVDTTAIIMGDYSNGNDGVVLKTGKTLADIKGQTVNSSSCRCRTICWRAALDRRSCSEKDIKTVNTSDADIVAAFKSPDIHRGGHLESAAAGGEGRAGRHAGVRLQQDPRRDRGSDGGQHRNAEGQSRPRQGAGRHLVRDDRADEGPIRRGQGRARGDGEAVGHRPRRLRGPAQDHAHVLHAQGRRRLHDRRRTARRSWIWSAASASSTISSART